MFKAIEADIAGTGRHTDGPIKPAAHRMLKPECLVLSACRLDTRLTSSRDSPAALTSRKVRLPESISCATAGTWCAEILDWSTKSLITSTPGEHALVYHEAYDRRLKIPARSENKL